MARYAPANSLVYLESNHPAEVFDSLLQTDAVKGLDRLSRNPRGADGRGPLQKLIAFTGIGPVESVIAARAQIAIVVTELGTNEEGETLRVKPEAAAIIDTHTSETRIRAPVREALRKLAERTYGRPVFRTSSIDGFEFMQWSTSDGNRQIVATIFGTVVIVGNSERSVRDCLAVTRGTQPSLSEDAELTRMRGQLSAADSMAFGYVPATNSARLLSVAIPLFIGRPPGDSDFQRLITAGAAKVFGSLGWTSHRYSSGIEDRYLVSLKPGVVSRLKSSFSHLSSDAEISQRIPATVQSLTVYNFETPLSAWQSMRMSVSSQLDTLSAVVFSSLLKASLVSYGIDDPEKFLEAVAGTITTMRIDQNAERSILVARIRDRVALTGQLGAGIFKAAKKERPSQNVEIWDDEPGETSAAFLNEFIVMGAPADVRRYVQAQISLSSNAEALRRITFYSSLSAPVNVATYTDDRDRVRSFLSTLVVAQNRPLPDSASLEQILTTLPYSATTSTLGGDGLQRTTRSPLGQFSTLLPLLLPESQPPSNTPSQ
jgi:hypothetical protein